MGYFDEWQSLVYEKAAKNYVEIIFAVKDIIVNEFNSI